MTASKQINQFSMPALAAFIRAAWPDIDFNADCHLRYFENADPADLTFHERLSMTFFIIFSRKWKGPAANAVRARLRKLKK